MNVIDVMNVGGYQVLMGVGTMVLFIIINREKMMKMNGPLEVYHLQSADGGPFALFGKKSFPIFASVHHQKIFATNALFSQTHLGNDCLKIITCLFFLFSNGYY